MPGALANFGRSLLEGLTFNNAGEIEAAIRAAAQGDPNKYRQIKAQVDAQYRQWADKNQGAALAGEFTGALAPGIAGAFVPGPGWGATASTIARAGRAMAEPVSVFASRVVPRFANAKALPYLDEALTGVVQSIGSADTMEDAPRRIAEDAPVNIAGSLGVRGVNTGIKKGLEVRKAKKGKK